MSFFKKLIAIVLASISILSLGAGAAHAEEQNPGSSPYPSYTIESWPRPYIWSAYLSLINTGTSGEFPFPIIKPLPVPSSFPSYGEPLKAGEKLIF